MAKNLLIIHGFFWFPFYQNDPTLKLYTSSQRTIQVYAKTQEQMYSSHCMMGKLRKKSAEQETMRNHDARKKVITKTD